MKLIGRLIESLMELGLRAMFCWAAVKAIPDEPVSASIILACAIMIGQSRSKQ